MLILYQSTKRNVQRKNTPLLWSNITELSMNNMVVVDMDMDTPKISTTRTTITVVRAIMDLSVISAITRSRAFAVSSCCCRHERIITLNHT